MGILDRFDRRNFLLVPIPVISDDGINEYELTQVLIHPLDKNFACDSVIPTVPLGEISIDSDQPWILGIYAVERSMFESSGDVDLRRRSRMPWYCTQCCKWEIGESPLEDHLHKEY